MQHSTVWSAPERLLSTRLTGVQSLESVRDWADALEAEAARIPADQSFAMLVDIRGYEVAEQPAEVHRVGREVIPRFLARHGFEVGFFRLLEVENQIPADPLLARCLHVAHVHHDPDKMERYEQTLGRDEERFFTDPGRAREWIGTTLAPSGHV